MLNKSKVVIIVSLMILIVSICWLFIRTENSLKVGYVKIQEVFDNFDMKKELQARLESTERGQKIHLDSLTFALQVMSDKLNAQKNPSEAEIAAFSRLKNVYLGRKKEFEEEKQKVTNEYNEQIISRMRQYINDYGREQAYTFILGDDNNGSIMYGAQEKNITPDVIQYLKQKYQGK